MNIEFSDEIMKKMHNVAEKFEPILIKYKALCFRNDVYNLKDKYQDVYESDVFKALYEVCSVNNSYILESGTIVCRARIINPEHLFKCENGIDIDENGLLNGYNWLNSKEPVIGFSESGRANAKYASYFYCSQNGNTAASEVKPYINDYISLAKFTVMKNLRLFNFDDISLENDTQKYNYIKFLEACFSAPIKDNKDYVMTQFLSDEIRKFGYDGICYKSIFTNDMNYVIFNCSKSNLEFKVSRVIKLYSQKLNFIYYDAEEIISTKENVLTSEEILQDKIKLFNSIEKTKKLFETIHYKHKNTNI